MRPTASVCRTAGFLLTLVMLLGVFASSVASAQGLGAVAKQEEERRKTVKSSGKVYTNDTIKSDPSTPSTPPPSTPAGSSAAAAPSGGSSAGDDSHKNDEKYWRQRAQDERDGLQRAQTLVDALQSQVNGLWAEFTACQAPPQCTQIANRRQKAMADLEKAKQDIQARTKAIQGVQDEARRAGVPAGWAR